MSLFCNFHLLNQLPLFLETLRDGKKKKKNPKTQQSYLCISLFDDWGFPHMGWGLRMALPSLPESVRTLLKNS